MQTETLRLKRQAETVEGNNNATAKKGADSKAGNRAANTAAANSNNAKAATTATTAKKNKGSVIQIFYNTSKHNTQDVDESEVALAEVARRLSSNPKLLIQIKAYADEQGDDKGFDNQKLTDVRAQETKDILVNKYGVDEKRIVLCKGFGSVKGAPSIDYQPNRRTDICFVQKIVQKPK